MPRWRRIRLRPIRLAELSFLIFLIVAMGLPLLFLLTGSFNLSAPGKPAVYGIDNWLHAFTDSGTLNALWMSFLLSVVRLIPAMILSVSFAWLIARTDMPGGRFIEAVCWIAYFVPDFPLVLAWILLLDPNFGFLNSAAKSIPGVDGALFTPYGFWGIVWVHTSTGGIWFKVMLLVPVFRRLGATLEEAARVAGASTATMLWRITLPVLAPMILAVSMLSFIRGLQSFNTELLLGTPAGIYVYSTKIYDLLQHEPRAYGEATALGSVFLFVSRCCCFLLEVFARRQEVYRGHRPGILHPACEIGQMALHCFRRLSALRRRDNAFAAGVSGHRLVHAPLRLFQYRFAVYLIHWYNMLSDPIFLIALKNSLIIAGTTAIGGSCFIPPWLIY